MTEPLSEHCLCDKCGSDECKAVDDNNTSKESSEKVLDDLATYVCSCKYLHRLHRDAILKKIEELRRRERVL